MTIETEVAALTSSTTALVNAVGAQQISVTDAVAAFTAATARVNTGLNHVDNTPDADKPLSTLGQEALNAKQATLLSGVNIKRVNGESLLGEGDIVIERSATSLNRVAYEDRGTLRALTPQVDDATMVESLGLFMWVNTLAEPDDDETCFSTATGQWLLQAPAVDLLEAWALFDKAVLEDWMEDEATRFAKFQITNK